MFIFFTSHYIKTKSAGCVQKWNLLLLFSCLLKYPIYLCLSVLISFAICKKMPIHSCVQCGTIAKKVNGITTSFFLFFSVSKFGCHNCYLIFPSNHLKFRNRMTFFFCLYFIHHLYLDVILSISYLAHLIAYPRYCSFQLLIIRRNLPPFVIYATSFLFFYLLVVIAKISTPYSRGRIYEHFR